MAGSAPAEIFFVDDRADNVAAAREAGFDAVPYTDAQSLIETLAARGIEL
jgi:FMN phosphatase YigB (HAD superfamily)